MLNARPMRSPARRLGLLVTLLLCVGVAGASCWTAWPVDWFPEPAMARFTIRLADTGAPVDGAVVTAKPASLHPGVHVVPGFPAPMPPTDASGTTYSSYAIASDDSVAEPRSRLEWVVAIEHPGALEEIQVENVPGTSARGAHFEITVVDNDSAPPAPPAPAMTSNGAVLINAFVSAMTVCDHDALALVHWYVSRDLSSYVAAASLAAPLPRFDDIIGPIAEDCGATPETASCDLNK